jgi:hypothetical protein
LTLKFKENLVQKDSVTQQKEDDIIDTDIMPYSVGVFISSFSWTGMFLHQEYASPDSRK